MHARPITTLLLILAVVFAIYAPSLANGFAMDDRLVAMGSMDRGKTNLMVIEFLPLGDYFGSHYWAGSQISSDLYRPITVLSYAARHHFFGDWPLPGHVLNLALHLAAVVLVFWMLRRLGIGVLATALGAATFGLHAIHSEVVASVVGRAELLAFVFGGTALALWNGSRCRSVPPRVGCAALAAIFLFLALCSKESAVAWVPFLVVFGTAVHWEEHRAALSWRTFGWLCLEIAAVCAVPLASFLALRAHALGSLPVDPPPIAFLVNQLADASLAERLPTGLWVWGYGLFLTVFPFQLAADYSTFVFTSIESVFDVRVLGTLFVFLALLFAAIRWRVRAPSLFVAAACFFGFSFLTSNIPLTIGTIFGERLFYTPSLAMAFVVAWGFRASARRPVATRLMQVAVAIWFVVCIVVVLLRNGVWKDNRALFLHEVENQPRSLRIQMAVASLHIDQGDEKAILEAFEKALAIDPENKLVLNNTAAILMHRGELQRAEQMAIRGLASTHVGGPGDRLSLLFNLGLIQARMKRMQAALTQMQLCLEERPGHLPAFGEVLGWQVKGLIRPGQLAEMLQRVAAKDASYRPYVEVYRGLLAHHAKRHAEGDRILRSSIDNLPAHEDLVGWWERIGFHLAAAGTPAAAIPWLQAALERRAYKIEVFRQLAAMAEDSILPADALDRWLAGRGDEPACRLYRALAAFVRSWTRRDPGLLQRTRSELEAVLPDLSRWYFRGSLLAECRLRLGDVCGALGDGDAAKRHRRAVADDPAMPGASRREALDRLSGK